MMKTTMHLHRPPVTPVAPASSPDRIVDGRVRPSTVRLGLALSLVAAVITLVLETAVDVPVIAILVPVVIFGFALSWHACGRPLASDRPDRSHPSRDDDVTADRRG